MYVCMYVCMCNWRLENIYVSETKYLKYQQNIEGNSSLRIGKCNFFLSSLARIFIDFSQWSSVLSVILSFIVPYHCNDCIMYVYMQMYFET